MDTRHLTDRELCSLAIPAGGSPEALPAHLSDCLACARSLSEWKAALAAVADDAGPFDGRTEEEWETAALRTIDRVRRSPRAVSFARIRSARATRWGIGIAAALLLAVLVLPLRPRQNPAHVAAETDRAGELSGQDQADDALLRDVARMARAEDDFGAVGGLAPEPRAPSSRDGQL
jgi:hypothetical protein